MFYKQCVLNFYVGSHLALSLIFSFCSFFLNDFLSFFVAIKILKKYIFADNAKGTFKSFEKSNLSSTNVPVFTCLRFKLLRMNFQFQILEKMHFLAKDSLINIYFS